MNGKLKLIVITFFIAVLSGCPSEEEVKKIQDDSFQKKDIAMKFLEAQDFSLEGLLQIQDYFFSFSEKVHLMKVEPETRKNIQRLIKSKGVKEFCKNFILPQRSVEPLLIYCESGNFYKCSPEIQEYKNTYNQFKQLIGSDLAKSVGSDSNCR